MLEPGTTKSDNTVYPSHPPLAVHCLSSPYFCSMLIYSLCDFSNLTSKGRYCPLYPVLASLSNWASHMKSLVNICSMNSWSKRNVKLLLSISFHQTPGHERQVVKMNSPHHQPSGSTSLETGKHLTPTGSLPSGLNIQEGHTAREGKSSKRNMSFVIHKLPSIGLQISF